MYTWHSKPPHYVSPSSVPRVLENPAAYAYSKDKAIPPTESMLRGTRIHQAVLDLDNFTETYVPVEGLNRTTKAGKEIVRELEKQGQLALKQEEFDLCIEAEKAFSGFIPTHFLPSIQYERKLPEDGTASAISNTGELYRVPVKGRVDFMSEEKPMVGEMKTISSFSINWLSTYINALIQCIGYSDTLFGEDWIDKTQVFVVLITSTQPVECRFIHQHDEDTLEICQHLWRIGAGAVMEFKRKGQWPGTATFQKGELTEAEFRKSRYIARDLISESSQRLGFATPEIKPEKTPPPSNVVSIPQGQLTNNHPGLYAPNRPEDRFGFAGRPITAEERAKYPGEALIDRAVARIESGPIKE